MFVPYATGARRRGRSGGGGFFEGNTDQFEVGGGGRGGLCPVFLLCYKRTYAEVEVEVFCR